MYCREIISFVKNGEAVIRILNIAECEQEINHNDIHKILYDNEVDYNIHFINVENNNNINRMNQIRKLVEWDHVNTLEK